jgi:polyisoprenoid-binding protein YceI
LCVDADRSRFRIRLGAAGLFSAFGHDHLIEARGMKGCAKIEWSQLELSSVELVFSTPAIIVLDPKHEKDRPEVQKTMETEVLQIEKFPEIRFKSDGVRVQKSAVSRFNLIVDGQLTIRGNTRAVSIPLVLTQQGAAEGKVSGRYSMKQSAFGIKPVRVAGGLVRVKDEMDLEFDLLLNEEGAR